ncbi:MAG: hypothetical protein KDD89_07495, partial [Anaerolineales bacterium]|nr:hypothetical protein [Anaerolineales bacterium]
PLVAPTLQIPERQALVASLPTASFINQIERIGYYSAAGGRVGIAPTVAQYARHLPPGEEEFWMGAWPFLPQDQRALKDRNMFHFMARPPVLTVPFRTQIVDDQTYLALQNSIDDRAKLDWLVSLMGQMQMLDLGKTREELACNQDNWHTFSNLPDIEKIKLVFEIWYLAYSDLYELRAFLQAQPKLSVWRMAHPDISFEMFVMEFILARRFVVRLLRALAQDKQKTFRWYSVPQFVEGVLKLDPEIYDRNDLGEFWGFSRDGKRDYPQEGDDWNEAVDMWLTMQFSGPLNWLNMVDLVVENGRAKAFRLTQLGAHLLAPDVHTKHTAVESGGTAEWLPDGSTMRFTPGTDVNALMGLVTRLAVPVSGVPFTYRLGGPGLERGFTEGETPQSIAAQFAQLDHPLPPEAQAYLENLYARFGRVHLYDNLTLLEFGDDTAVVELRAAGLLDGLILYEFSPRLIAIQTDQAEDLFQKLQNKGYTPQMTTGKMA